MPHVLRGKDPIFFPVKAGKMQLFSISQRAFMATTSLAGALRSIPRASFSSASGSVKWDGGVSMVQGASRGIGLEFVSITLSYNQPFQIISLFDQILVHTWLIDTCDWTLQGI